MFFRPVMRFDPDEKKFRLFRVVWGGKNKLYSMNYSERLSVCLMPRLFLIKRGHLDLRIVIAGISFHLKRTYSGNFV